MKTGSFLLLLGTLVALQSAHANVIYDLPNPSDAEPAAPEMLPGELKPLPPAVTPAPKTAPKATPAPVVPSKPAPVPAAPVSPKKENTMSLAQLIEKATQQSKLAFRYRYGSQGYDRHANEAIRYYEMVPDQYQRESRGKNIAQLHADMAAYSRKAKTYNYGTAEYEAYAYVVSRASDLAKEKFRQDVRRLSKEQRVAAYEKYVREAYKYGSNTMEYDHYAKMAMIVLEAR